MRLFILLFIGIFIGIIGNLKAAVNTDTHTYIVSAREDKVLVIDRKTGAEQCIDVGNTPVHISIHGMVGYVVNTHSHDLSIIDLRTHKVTQTVEVGREPSRMLIHGACGYVLNRISNDISVVDLQMQKVIKTLTVDKKPYAICAHGDLGYVLHEDSNYVCLLNFQTNSIIRKTELPSDSFLCHVGDDFIYLNIHSYDCVNVIDSKTGIIKHCITVGRGPNQMYVRNTIAYVLNSISDDISVIDLKTNEVKCTIPIGEEPKSMVFQGELGYLRCNYSKNIYVIDLKIQSVIRVIKLGEHFDHFRIIGEGRIGLLFSGYSDITLVDLHLNKIIKTVERPNDFSADISDTHFYFGTLRGEAVPDFGLQLFDFPYEGIQGLYLDEDRDAAFEKFEQSALSKDYQTARFHFNIAISLGHPKAYAIAFKAFCHGLWGACQDNIWAQKFIAGMDDAYCQRLSANQNYPHSLKFKDKPRKKIKIKVRRKKK